MKTNITSIVSILVLFCLISGAAFAGPNDQSPIRNFTDKCNIPGYIYFVVDTSCSMRLTDRALSAKLVKDAINSMPDGWHFNVCGVADTAETAFSSWQAKTPETLRHSMDFARHSDQGTQTNLHSAMRLAARTPPGKGLPVLVVLITDGLIDNNVRDSIINLFQTDWKADERAFMLFKTEYNNNEAALEMTKKAYRESWQGFPSAEFYQFGDPEDAEEEETRPLIPFRRRGVIPPIPRR